MTMTKALMYEVQYKDYSPDFVFYENSLDKEIPVVEFGSGTGRITSQLLKSGFTVFGIEKEISYKKYFIETIKDKPYSEKFNYLNDVSEIDFHSNIIFPFNVLFYLTENEIVNVLNKIKQTTFNKIIFETDNIQTVKEENFLTKEHWQDQLLFIEETIRDNSRIIIKNEVFQDNESILKFQYPLYIHKSDFLLNSYRSIFTDIKLFGDFDFSSYNLTSKKLIAVIDK